MDRKALIGLLSGVTVVIATLIGVGLANTREAEGAPQPAQVIARDCATGYGLAPRHACQRVD